MLPGLALAAAVMGAAMALSGLLGGWVLQAQGIAPGGRSSPISAIMLAIVLGLAVANTVGVSPRFAPGLELCVKKVLRLGIILVGIRLSFYDLFRLGALGLPVVVVVIATAILVTRWLGRRMGVSDRLATLAAASTAICGVTATVAVAPTIGADDREVAYTIANVTLYGLVAMFAYPYLAHALFAAAPGSVGAFLGTSIHETAQVMGAALTYREVFGDEVAFQVATLTKLTRNVMLVAVVPVLAYAHARAGGAGRGEIRIAKLFPLFVLGFLAMAALRTVGDAGLSASGRAFWLWEGGEWGAIVRWVGDRGAHWALGAAMAGVGLSTSLKVLKGMGAKPLYLGAVAAVVVGAVSLLLALILGPYIGR
jgi:uncharacterized integral membrane protein (TIGR00698 family)